MPGLPSPNLLPGCARQFEGQEAGLLANGGRARNGRKEARHEDGGLHGVEGFPCSFARDFAVDDLLYAGPSLLKSLSIEDEFQQVRTLRQRQKDHGARIDVLRVGAKRPSHPSDQTAFRHWIDFRIDLASEEPEDLVLLDSEDTTPTELSPDSGPELLQMRESRYPSL